MGLMHLQAQQVELESRQTVPMALQSCPTGQVGWAEWQNQQVVPVELVVYYYLQVLVELAMH